VSGRSPPESLLKEPGATYSITASALMQSMHGGAIPVKQWRRTVGEISGYEQGLSCRL